MMKFNRNDIIMTSLIVVVILLFRILYMDIFQSLIIEYSFDVGYVFRSFVSNIVVLLLSVTLDVVGVWKLSKRQPYGQNSISRFMLDILLITIVSALGALVLNFKDYNTGATIELQGLYYVFSILCVFLLNAFLVGLLDLFFFALQVRESVRLERIQKRQAEYQYHKLKEQLNPHFLFNSLNLLDYLVQSHEDDRASEYIKKLANIYRYFIQNNDISLVSIEEELKFVGYYVDLLKVRFPEGFVLTIDVPDEYRDAMIIPCGLQILVENAIKHNVVSKMQPLHIVIKVEDSKLIVWNNIQLKISVNESMNVGLNNICQQYIDVTGQQVEIIQDALNFTVKLPIVMKNN